MRYFNSTKNSLITIGKMQYYNGNLCMPTEEELISDGYELLPEVEEVDELTPNQLRQIAYDSEPIINWQGEMLTCDKARLERMSVYYYSNQTEKLQQLQALWFAARTEIQNRYPDLEII